MKIGVFKKKLKGKIVIVGIGNTLRGDDGAGPELIRRLKNFQLPTSNSKLLLIDAGSVPENFLQKIAGHKPNVILLVDTVNLGKPAGSVEIIEGENLKEGGFSTHNASLKLTIEYLRKETKAEVLLLGIQPKNIGFGQRISPEVEKSINSVITFLSLSLNIPMRGKFL
ncbi:MAG: hydrogenase maturation peptidase HycI [Candidatus Omnitrophica bacterium]|nr:hydrogenase maturation peptidase HycI [Candidatus Omnitrophota bacterium]